MLEIKTKAISGRFLKAVFVMVSSPDVFRFRSYLISLRVSPGDVKYFFLDVCLADKLVFTSDRSGPRFVVNWR